MESKTNSRCFGLNKRIVSFLHHTALLAILHSSFVAPAQGIIDAYIHNTKPVRYSGSNGQAYNLPEGNQNIIQSQTAYPEYEVTAAKAQTGNTAGVNFFLFNADIKEGIIGVSKDKPLDNPSDNLFKVNLDELPSGHDKVYLTYEVFGVADHHSVARSINERLSVGGYLVKKQLGWSEQKEEINPAWLHKGQNTILFTIPASADYQYKVRNLAVKVEKSSSVNSLLMLSNRTITFSKDNKVYVKGFLRGNYPDAKVDANGTFLQVINNEFEGYITLTDEIKRNGLVMIKATAGNQLLGQEIQFVDNAIEADRIFPFERKEESVSKLFKAGTVSRLEMDGASIIANDSALVKDYEVSVSRLRDIDVAPMESGMINVTKGGRGYRFLPDGTKFEKPVSLSIAYDSKLIPTGYTEKDIRTYYFDTNSKRWVAVHKDSIDSKNNAVISKTTHFTDYINGIVQAPDSPETSAFTPTMMSDIKAADPSAEMTLISPPSASQKGDANISYPIKLPAGRRGMQPQLALQYSNEGGNGWLGLGWNLSVPSLSIDTKWGVPLFDPASETELYSLNGEQLMYPGGYLPHRHNESGGIITTNMQNRNTDGTKLFFPRKQGSFEKIERLGNTPQTYYWKVTNTDGTIYWYGGKSPNDVQAALAVLKDSNQRIVHWALFMVEDVYGNTMKYSYETFINNNTSSNLYQGQQLYLTKINYTGYGNDLGNYDVEFLRKTSRQDVNINARLGIKQIDFHLLEQIKVYYKTQPVRSYFLNYTTGRFNKSLLQSVAERDAAGVEFYRHTFDYYDDIKKSDGTDAYFSAEIEEKICEELPVENVTDTDNDGVPDSQDWCINLPGSASNNGCPEDQTPSGPTGPTGTDPVTGQKLYCYEVDIQLPLQNERYRYNLGGSAPNTNLYGSICEYKTAKAGFILNNVTYAAPAIYTSHVNGTGFVNLCPSYSITATEANPDPVIQNPNFATQFKSWLETQVLSPFLDSNSNLSVINKSGVYKFGTYIQTTNNYTCSFETAANLTGEAVVNGYDIAASQSSSSSRPISRQIIAANGINLPVAIDGVLLSPTGFNMHEDFTSLKSSIEALYGGTATLEYSLSKISISPLYLNQHIATLKFHNVLQPMSSITIGNVTYDLNKCKDPSHPGHDNNSLVFQDSQNSLMSSESEEVQDNYNIDFEATVPVGDPDCPSLLNLDFLLQGNIPSYNSAASLLGSSKTKGYNVGIALSLGLGCKFTTKSTTFGGQFNYSHDNSESFTAMIDIDGDGLDDLVFKGYSGSLYYNKHIVERTYVDGQLKIKHSFSSPETISGINNFYKANSNSTSGNFQVTFGFSRIGGFAGIDFSGTKSQTNVYFTDGNGDGLPDIVKNGTVFFNRLVNGKPEFIPNSTGTPNLVIKAKPKTIEVPDEYNETEIKIPDYDVIKVWEAPYEGAIAITNDIVLTDPTQEVVVTIETRIKDFSSGVGCLLYGKTLNSSVPEIHETIMTNLFGADCISDSNGFIHVIPGQLVFFRVHANTSGINPKINWDPVVEYINSPTTGVLDQNSISTDRYQYSQNFLLSQKNSPVIFPGNGTATLSWDDIMVNAPSDDVTFEIYQTEITTAANGDVENSNSNDQLIYKRFCPTGVNTLVSPSTNDVSGGVISNIAISSNYAPGSNNSTTAFYFKIKSDSNVNWKQIEWKPQVNCTTLETVIGVDNTPEGTVTTNQTFYGIPDVTIYKVFNIEVDDYTDTAATFYAQVSNLSSGQALYMKPYLNGVFSSTDNGTMQFVVKRDGVALDRRSIYVNNGNVTFDNNSPIYIGTATNDKMEIGFYSDDTGLPDNQSSILSKLYPSGPYAAINVVQLAAGSWNSGSSTFLTNRDVNLFHIPSSQKFGPMHRQWGQFAYNPSLVENATPSPFGDLLHASYLVIQPDTNQLQTAVNELENLGENITEQDMLNFQSQYQGMYSSIPFLPMYPKREVVDNQLSEKWFGACPQNYASALSYRAAGMDEIRDEYIDPDDYVVQEVLETGAYGIDKYNKGKSKNLAAGLSAGVAPGISVGASVSKSLDSDSNLLTDYIDINGDRYPDIVTSNKIQFTQGTGGLMASVDSNSAINGQGGSDVSKSTNSSLGFAASGSFSVGGKDTASTSGDGMDKPRFYGFKGNSGAGISGNFSNGESSTTRMWADVNGDGLADMLEKSPDYINVRLNMGNNVFQPMQLNASSWGLTEMFNSKSHSYGGGLGVNLWNGSVEIGMSLGGGRNDVENTLVDMNGDGIADVVHSDSNGILVRVNKGNSFVPEIRWSDFRMNHESESNMSSLNAGLTVAFTIPIPFIGTCLKIPAVNPNGGDFTSTNRTKKSISDFDGDGFPDLISEVNNTTLSVQYSNIRRTNMLKSVQNPLGGSFTVDYDVITPTYNNPSPKWVMKNVVIEDGYDLVNDGVDSYSKNFEYQNGYYDRREREFYGYETVKTIDNILDEDGEITGVYRTAVSVFHNASYYLNGLTKWSHVMKGNDTNQLLSRSINTYKIKTLTNTGLIDLNAAAVTLSFDTGGAEGRRAAAVLLTSTENYIYEFGTTPLKSKVEFTYNDTRGRITKYDYKGDVAVSTDNYTAEITYFPDPALETKNIYTVPGSIVVKDHNNVERRRRTVETIDSNTGAITMIGAKINATELAETLMWYDQYGNLSKISGPQSADGQWFTYTYKYDPDNHKLPIIVEDSFGYVSSTSYDLSIDKPFKINDITGNEMTYDYDNFGRLVTIKSPNEIQNNIPYTISFGYYPKFDDLHAVYNCTSEDNFMPVAVTSHYDPQHPGNDIQTYTFIDGMARPVQVKKDIEMNLGDNGSPNLTEAVSVSGKVFYDQYGRAIKQYHPYFENKECSVNLVINEYESPYVATTEYDVADRPVQSIDPEGNTSAIEYSIGSDASSQPALKTKSSTDQNGSQNIVSETYKDVNGRTTSSVNILTGTGATNILTKFNYNSIGELMSYTDAENLSTTYKYDMLGRKIEMVHPDNGKTTYEYDHAGNITKLQTANLAADNSLQPADRFIRYYYEFNRLNKIVYPSTPAGSNISNVGYDYGSSGNETGRIIQQTDATGTQYFQYGNMGEVINNTRVVVGPNIPTRTFTTAFTYDSWNRINTITYPDGEIVSHQYNLGGNLVKITGDVGGSPYDYIQRIDYDYFEQKTYQLYGNGTDMAYDYTPALRRLNTMVARTSNQNNFLDNTYSYDKVGNVTSLVNNAPASSNNLMGGTFEHTYSYDNLNRLISASGSFTGDTNQASNNNDYVSAYGVDLTYNTTHGITEKRQEHNKNGQSVAENTYRNAYAYYEGTHKIEALTDQFNPMTVQNYKYDANGNTVYIANTGDGSMKDLYWDESNRLRVLSDQHSMQHYIYDANGERVLKASAQPEQLYSNGLPTDGDLSFDSYTTYPSAYIVVNPDGQFSKHYYAGSQRIVSRVADQNASIFEIPAPRPAAATDKTSGSGENKTLTEDELRKMQISDLTKILEKAKKGTPVFKKYKLADVEETDTEEEPDEAGRTAMRGPAVIALYFYHPDHLGTSTFLTDSNGELYQFFLNLPFGETMAEQHSLTQDYATPYKFNAKELDSETGLYYYGARYYDPRASIFLSTDPLMEDYPNHNPYVYCYQNPINIVDPTGMEGVDPKQPGRVNVVVIDGRDKPTDEALKVNIEAVKKLDPSVIVIRAKNKKDMLSQMKDKLGDNLIGTLIIASHGNYDDSSVQIGSTTLQTDSEFETLGKQLSGYTDKDSNIAFTSCHSGGGSDLKQSESHMIALSKGSGGATIYAPMTWGAARTQRFSNGNSNDPTITKAAVTKIPDNYRSPEAQRKRANSVKNLDRWRIYNPEKGRSSTAKGIYFTRTGNIRN